MLKPSYTTRFEKDLKRQIKRGFEKQKIKKVINKLIAEEKLEKKYRDHKLAGNYKDRRECHIDPDWLLIYKIGRDEIIFERTGSHSDLFE